MLPCLLSHIFIADERLVVIFSYWPDRYPRPCGLREWNLHVIQARCKLTADIYIVVQLLTLYQDLVEEFCFTNFEPSLTQNTSQTGSHMTVADTRK